MTVPDKPSFFDIPGAINAGVDSVQGFGRAISGQIDKLQGQLPPFAEPPLPDLSQFRRKDAEHDSELGRLRNELSTLRELYKNWEGANSALTEMKRRIGILENAVKSQETKINLLEKESESVRKWQAQTFPAEQERQSRFLTDLFRRENEKRVQREEKERKAKDAELQREINKQNDWRNILDKRIKEAEAKANESKAKADSAVKKADESLKKVEKVFNDIGNIAKDLKIKTAEITQIKFDIKTIQAFIKTGLPALIKSIFWSIILSAAFNAVIAGIIGAFNNNSAKNALDTALRALGLAQSAKDDARGAATIAVKAEGKADTANARIDGLKAEVDGIVAGALSAMKRLENEIKFLTEASRQAMLRLQERIANLEKYTGDLSKIVGDLKGVVLNLQKQVSDLTTFTNNQITNLQKTVDQFKNDLLQQLSKLQKQIPDILAKIALFTTQIAGILLTIAGIQALLRRFNPGGNNVVVNNNNFINNNNYITNVDRRTTIVQQAPDLSLLKKIDNTTTRNLQVSAANFALSQTMDNKLGPQIENKDVGISGKLLRGFNWLILDRAMNMLTLAVTIHNGAMLSQNIVQTLTQAMQNIVDLIGIKNDKNETIQLSTLISSSVSDFIKNVVGKENYDFWIKEWNKYNRIYQASANLFSSLLDMADTTLFALQVIAGQTSKIGNALRNAGTVFENAYGWFNPTPNFSNPLFTKLERLEETASVVENVTQQPLNVKASKEDLEESAKQLADSLAQNPGAKEGVEPPEASKVRQKAAEAKEVSQGRDVDPEDKVEDDS